MKYSINNQIIGITLLLISAVSSGSKVPYRLLQEQEDISLHPLKDEKKAQEASQKSKKTKRQLLSAAHEKFVDAYKKRFEEIWQNKAQHQKVYEAGKKAGSQNAAIASSTAQEYIHQLMRDAYKVVLKEYYPEDEMLENPEKLQEQADDLIEEYLEVTCSGCCWGE